jgi:hypothetical protein
LELPEIASSLAGLVAGRANSIYSKEGCGSYLVFF